MNQDFKDAYKNLDINEKRNQLSNEIIIISELIKKMENSFGIESLLNVKNYDSIKDQKMLESEMLEFLYEDIYNIQKELLTLYTVISSK